MWSEWMVIAQSRLQAGDMEGARLAAMVANDCGGPCPVSDAVLVEGWNAADDLRRRLDELARLGPWKPRPGMTSCAKTHGVA